MVSPIVVRTRIEPKPLKRPFIAFRNVIDSCFGRPAKYQDAGPGYIHTFAVKVCGVLLLIAAGDSVESFYYWLVGGVMV